MTAPAADAPLVAVLTATPPPTRRALVTAALEAAARSVGVAAVDDLVERPEAGVVVVLLDGVTIPAEAARSLLAAHMAAALAKRGSEGARVEVGLSVAPTEPLLRSVFDSWVRALREEASISARRLADTEALTSLLLQRDVRTRFQPIVEVASGRVVGWEALSAGPLHHQLAAIGDLLDAARGAGVSSRVQTELVRVARRRGLALSSAEGRDDLLLFLNCSPTTLEMVIAESPDAPGLWPWNRIVVEVTEGEPIADAVDFLRQRDLARGLGVRFALDDVGAGNAGLAALALLAPDFIKIDAGLVRRCEVDPYRRGIIAALVHLGAAADARVIAEGVETVSELETIVELGVDLVQGYILAPPSETSPQPSAIFQELIGRVGRLRQQRVEAQALLS